MTDIASALPPRSADAEGARTRRARRHPAHRSARPTRRASDRRRRRDPQAPGPRGRWARTPCALSPPTSPTSRPGRSPPPARPWPGRPPRRWRSNSSRITSGIRRSAKPTTAMACRPTSTTPCAPTACCEPKARTRPTPSGVASRAGRPLHRWRGLDGPFASPALRYALRLAVRASGRPHRRKSERAVTRDILDRLTATCRSDELVDVRDLAILMAAFGSGGRRRSEIAGLRFEQLRDDPPVLSDPTRPDLDATALPLGPTRPHQDDRGQRRRQGPHDRRTRRGAESLDRTRQDRPRRGLPRHRPLGDARGTGAEPAISEPDRQAPLRRRRAESAGILRAWACAPAILPRRRARACRCPKLCSSLNTDPSNRLPAITTTPIGQRARPRGWRSERPSFAVRHNSRGSSS